MTRQEHVETLAKELCCHLVQKPKMPGMMFVEFGYIEGPTITNQVEYLTMLHELGHVAWGHTQGRPPQRHKQFYFKNGVLKSEAQAWEWALDHCSETLEDESRRFMWDTCLGSYYEGSLLAGGEPDRLWNGNRHHVLFTYDKPDAYFTGIVQRIQGDLKDWKRTYEP